MQSEKLDLHCNVGNQSINVDSASKFTHEKFHRLLTYAVRKGHQSQVQEFLKQKPQLNSTFGDQLLQKAVRGRRIEIIILLIEAGANIQNCFNRSAPKKFLHRLCVNMNPRKHELAKLLMAKGADVNVFDNNRAKPLYPLDYAIDARSPIEIIKELLKHGARVDSFHLVKAAKHPEVAELMPLLVSAIPDVRTRSRCVTSALLSFALWSIGNHILPAVKILLELNLHKKEMTMNSLTLLRAIYSCEVEMVRLFIQFGFDVNNRALASYSALYLSSLLEKSTICELLLQAGAEVNVLSISLNGYKGYPIHEACSRYSLDHMKLLLRHGADINVTDSRGYTPLSLMDIDRRISDYPEHQMFIKYMAIYVRQGKVIHDTNLKIIEKRSEMHKYYTECFSELDKMEEMKIIKNLSFISMFNKSGQMHYSIRDSNFLEAYSKTQRKVDFPIYNEEMDFAFENIKSRKTSFEEKEKAICESLNHILPYIPLEKVIYYFYLDVIE